MVSKRRISYQWRLFFPFVLLIWLMLLIVGVWMNSIQTELKIDSIKQQVKLINQRIVTAWDQDVDPKAFLEFAGGYYEKNELYDEIQLSVYHNSELVYNIGNPINVPDVRGLTAGTLVSSSNPNIDVDDEATKNFFYDNATSEDGKIRVYSILPFSTDILKATRTSNTVFLILLAIALGATVAVYFIARRIGKNITLLRDFAQRASADPNFVPATDFAHDELGEISHEIVKFFNARNRSIAKLKREHEVTIHAIEEKTRMKRELTNNVNHELKTPVGVIKGYLDTIKEHPEMDNDARQHFLDKMSQHVDRLVQFLEDLSSITRLEYGSQMINSEPVDFHEIAFQAISDLETSGVMGQMEINYDIPTYCRVIGNTGLLMAMISNLAKNSAAYSRGTECNLVLEEDDGEFYHFAFYDNGIGVKEASIPHLFERFFREDSGRSRKKGGTGLGLCIVQNTIEALGGTITAANRKGGGLIFRFTLRKVKPNQ